MTSNTLEFFVRMKDLMSSGLAKLAKNARDTFGKIKSDIDDTVTKNKKLADSFENVDKKVNKTSFSLSGLARNLGIAISLASVLSFAKSSAQAYMDYNAKVQTFQVLTRNQGTGSELAGRLNKLQQDTILGPEVFKSAQTLMAFGVTAGEVEKDLRQLGDISMGNKDRFQALTLAFAQTRSAGKLMGQDLLQYVNAGFNPLQVMSEKWKEFGFNAQKSVGDLRELMQKGEISSQMVAKAFELATSKGGMFEGMLDKMGETSQGKWQQLSGQWEALKITFGEKLKPVIDGTATALSSVVNGMNNMLKPSVAQTVQDQINKIRGLQTELTSLGTSEQRRVDILHELEQINPNIVKGINEQAINYKTLAENIDKVTAALNQKKIAETFQNQNIDVITAYNEAVNTKAATNAEIFSLLAQIDPTLAASNMSPGKKVQKAIGELRARVNSGNVDVYKKYSGRTLIVGSTQKDQLDRLMQLLGQGSEAQKTIAQNAGQVKAIQDKIKAATDEYNKFYGLSGTAVAAAGDSGSGGNGGNGGNGGGGGSDIVRSVASGGPRTININGVKFADKIEVHGESMDDAYDKTETKLQEMYLRILNSGASVQQ